MPENLLRSRFELDRILFGAYLPFPSPDLVEVCGLLGFDWIFVDAEHGAVDLQTILALVRAAEVVGLATVVRVPSAEPTVTLRYIETGVDGLLAPHIATPAAAEVFVSGMRYPPHGVRGAFARSRAANYGLTQPADAYYADTANHAIPIAMLEDATAFEHLERLCQVDGLDVFFIGAGDLAMSMGFPGQPDQPDVTAQIALGASHLARAGKIFGLMAGSPEAVAAAARLGCRLVAVDLGGIFTAGASRYLSESRLAIADG
jgi:4-hydroxy-2-oxoheptanedioate aldolase